MDLLRFVFILFLGNIISRGNRDKYAPVVEVFSSADLVVRDLFLQCADN